MDIRIHFVKGDMRVKTTKPDNPISKMLTGPTNVNYSQRKVMKKMCNDHKHYTKEKQYEQGKDHEPGKGK